MRVFLGGTCTGHNWREQIIPKLHCDYFNPLVENWTEECRLIEEKEKKRVMLWYTAMQDVVQMSCGRI